LAGFSNDWKERKEMVEMATRVTQVVGLGASAGGLEALETFFENMPQDTGMAFVVVQHLSPDYKSLMVELLSRRTHMNVVRVEDGMVVEPNSIYLITPKNNMIIFDGRLLLTEQERTHINLPIDIFFRSLAEDQGANAIGIILSGTGSDGMRGVRAIKEAGGMVMVQAEETAKFDGMPRAALSTGLVDFVLPLEEMPAQLITYLHHPNLRSVQKEASSLVTDEDNMSKLLTLLHKRVGIDFTLYKPNTVIRRLERRMNINQIWSLEDYIRYLEKSPREINTLFKEMLIGVTNFFRDTEAFAVLQDRVVPDLFERMDPGGGIRIWVAGCSTGEEAYSLAILFREEIEKRNATADVKIFATDLDRSAVDFAAAGIYPESCVADLSPERLSRFFLRQGENYQVSRKLREMIVFAQHNLLKDPPFTRMDLVTCRNLLIYLQPKVQKKLLSFFEFSLRPGGFLFLGSSETLGDYTSQFEVIDNKWKIYRSRDARRAIPEMIGYGASRDRLHLARSGTHNAFRNIEDERYLEPLYQAILKDHVPASVVVDENHDILHVFSDVSDYLNFPVGKLSTNILKTVRRELASALGAALRKAGKSLKEVSYQNVDFSLEGARRSVDLLVRPFEDRKGKRTLFIVYFKEKSDAPLSTTSDQIFDARSSCAERIADLERDLQFTKENLQATIEELETSNEELQATNEELVSSNEELQSTNEELQSVNEELYTVNAEFQNKISELVVLNNDMDNLLHSMNLGTLFLDEQLNIRKFTSQVTSILNVRESDVGRPLPHLSHRLLGVDLPEEVRGVLDQRVTKELEVQTEAGLWVLLLIAPYRKDGVPTRSGVVITFVDITKLKKVQVALQKERDLLTRTMQITPLGMVILGRKGEILSANSKAEELFGISAKEMKMQSLSFFELVHGMEDLAGQSLLEDDLPQNKILQGRVKYSESRYILRMKDGRAVHLSHNAFPLSSAEGEVEGVLNIFREVCSDLCHETVGSAALIQK
jgi:two-component system, chemotaxis family, CheB/CheR fusion protein